MTFRVGVAVKHCADSPVRLVSPVDAGGAVWRASGTPR
jgi:hypothetical protein